MRDELTNVAGALAAELRNAADQIAWNDDKTTVRPDDIHTALFNFLYGPRVQRIDAVLKARGFEIDDISGGIVPQQLYERSSFVPLANAFTELATATAQR